MPTLGSNLPQLSCFANMLPSCFIFTCNDSKDGLSKGGGVSWKGIYLAFGSVRGTPICYGPLFLKQLWGN